MGEKTVNPSIEIYKNNIQNRITFKIKQDIIFNFELLKQKNYLEVLKVR